MVRALRNIAIIAHVDHGKTTLVDKMLSASGTFGAHEKITERAMDSNDLEKERGITILAKTTSIALDDTRINIVDTPGHADFGGEVERILNMVDGALMLVDAAEGPMPQTKFVLSKALKIGLNPIVVINKVDKSDSRAHEVVDEVFDLFTSLDANEDQLNFPYYFGSAKQGWFSDDPDKPTDNLNILFEAIKTHVPEPKTEDGPFRFLATTLNADPFLGRILTGRITSGVVKPNMPVHVLDLNGKVVERGRISKVLAFRGLKQEHIEEGRAGDIVALAGLTDATVSNTICETSITTPLATTPIDPPTLSMTFRVNDSPLAGTEGDKVTSRMIRARLLKEAEGNVALKITEKDEKDAFEVAGRGELQLSVLIETMRREGFELAVSRPEVVMREHPETGEKLEPYEDVMVDVDEEYSGTIVQKLTERKADLLDLRPSGIGRTRILLKAPTRSLIGYHSEMLSDSRGTAIMNRTFAEYGPYKGTLKGRNNGVLISTGGQGDAVAYALFNLQDRGLMMITPGDKVYDGMIVGEHNRGNDLEINVLKTKKLSNVRAAGKDDSIILTPPMAMPLEKALSYIQEDELVEITPSSIRLRKKHLDPNERKRHAKAAAT